MESAPALLVFVLLSVAYATLLSAREDRAFLATLVFSGWLLLAPLTSAVDAWMPFTVGGDDRAYFLAATRTVKTWAALVDPMVFREQMEQIGYPWLLAGVHLLFAPGLLGLKLFNLFLYLLVVVTWYRIGYELVNRKFGRSVAFGLIALTPMWFYFFFLLKDLSVVLVESIFLLSLVRTWRGTSLRAWLLVASACIAVLPLRSPLLLQNIAVAAGSLLARLVGPGSARRRVMAAFAGVTSMALLAVLASDAGVLSVFGIVSENRVVGSAAMWEMGRQYGETSQVERVIFPVVYLLSETSGLSPIAWTVRDVTWFRGVLALPWIVFTVPMFLRGLTWLAKRSESVKASVGCANMLLGARVLATPWSALVLFVASSMTVSWLVGDTTRWRVPDMPAVTAIAVAGWCFGDRRTAIAGLFWWLFCAATAFVAYYFLFRAVQ